MCTCDTPPPEDPEPAPPVEPVQPCETCKVLTLTVSQGATQTNVRGA